MEIDKSNKLDLTLVPWEAKLALAVILTEGLKKHEREGWRNVDRKTIEAALERHLLDYSRGVYKDADSGYPPSFHILANAAFLAASDVEKLCWGALSMGGGTSSLSLSDIVELTNLNKPGE